MKRNLILETLSVAGMLTLAACGGGTGEPPDLSPYTIDTRGGAPALIAFHGAHGWEPATETEPGLFTFTPTGESVEYASACVHEGGYASPTVNLLALSDDRDLRFRCGGSADAVDVDVQVNPAQAQIAVKNGWFPGRVNGGRMHLPPGTTDMVAYTDSRVLIRRGVTIPPTAPLSFDVVADGTELEPLPVRSPAIASGERLTMRSTFLTAGGTQPWFPEVDAAPTLGVVPASLRIAGDTVGVMFAAYRGSASRSVWKMGDVGGDVSLPPGITDASVSWNRGLHLRWKAPVADYAVILIAQNAADGSFVSYNISADEGWLRANAASGGGEITAPDLSALPGWEHTRLDPSNAAGTTWILGLSSFDDAASITYDAEWSSEPMSPASARAADRLRAVRAAHQNDLR